MNYIDTTPEHQCNCCPNKVGRGFSEAAFGIGPGTFTRCKTCEEKHCVPFVQMLIDMGMSIKNGWGKYGSRVGILRDGGCTIFQHNDYVLLANVLSEYEEDIDTILASVSKHELVNSFEEKSGIFFQKYGVK